MAIQNIKILGVGCANCKNLFAATEEIVAELGIDAEIEYITDMSEVGRYVMATPGVVIDGKVVHQGKPVPTRERVRELLTAAGS